MIRQSFVNSFEIIPEFKVVLVGDEGAGKTTFIKGLLTYKFQPEYTPTLHADVTPVLFTTTKGQVKLNIWDTPAHNNLGEGIILEPMGVGNSNVRCELENSLQNLLKWYSDITRVCDKIPIVLARTKVDLKIKPKFLKFHKIRDMKYSDVSVKLGFNCQKPFLQVLRSLLDDPGLGLVKISRGIVMDEG